MNNKNLIFEFEGNVLKMNALFIGELPFLYDLSSIFEIKEDGSLDSDISYLSYNEALEQLKCSNLKGKKAFKIKPLDPMEVPSILIVPKDAKMKAFETYPGRTAVAVVAPDSSNENPFEKIKDFDIDYISSSIRI